MNPLVAIRAHWASILGLFIAAALPMATIAAASPPVVLLIAGKPSHGPGEHEFNAGALLFRNCLRRALPEMECRVFLDGQWPAEQDFQAASSIVIYCNGGDEHILLDETRRATLGRAIERGAGLVALHYAVEFAAHGGRSQALAWLGGYFEVDWSVNPTWTPEFRELPHHPVARGVSAPMVRDEWYYHLRFAQGGGKITPILTAVPPPETVRKNGPRSGNPQVRAAVARGAVQEMAWVFESDRGGRAFGFTGGHFHKNWGDAEQRKLVLNAIAWTAGSSLPPGGIESAVSEADLMANLDPKPPRK